MIHPPKEVRRFDALLEVVTALRGQDGCPWDKEQTHRTLTPFAIEEAHELAEAIEHGTTSEVIGELGDVLLQVALHAEIGRQAGAFSIEDVIEGVVTKMVRRHPHVFASGKAITSQDVLASWDEIKKAERAENPGGISKSKQLTFDIPVSLPSLARAQKIGAKTKASRFDWPNWQGVESKVDEELMELKNACAAGSKLEQEHELGDLLFSLAQLARHLGLDAEQSLRTANARFERRYVSMREIARSEGVDFDLLLPEEMEAYWRKAKALEAKGQL